MKRIYFKPFNRIQFIKETIFETYLRPDVSRVTWHVGNTNNQQIPVKFKGWWFLRMDTDSVYCPYAVQLLGTAHRRETDQMSAFLYWESVLFPKNSLRQSKHICIRWKPDIDPAVQRHFRKQLLVGFTHKPFAFNCSLHFYISINK